MLSSILRSFTAGALLLALGASPALADVRIGILDVAEPARVGATAPTKMLAVADNALVLPYYSVDLSRQNGETTLFAVRNNADEALVVRYSFFDAEGGSDPLVLEELTLDAHAVRSVNMRYLPGLVGGSDSYATGYMVVEVVGRTEADLVLGDYFRIDSTGAAANGGTLVDVERTNCQRWSHRFFSGGAFNGGTEISFLALDAPAGDTTVAGNVYDEDGNLLSVVSITSDEPAFEVADTDLSLPVDFGTIDWIFQGQGHGVVITTFTAAGLLSVGTEATCVDDLGSDSGGGDGGGGDGGGGDGGGGDGGGGGGGDDVPPGTEVFEIPGTFLVCNRCGNWQYDMPFGGSRQFRKIVVDFDFRVSNFDPNRPNGFHCIFWLNNGTRWQDMIAYVNSRGTQGRTTFQSNGPLGSPIGVERYASPTVQQGQTYSMHFEYDTEAKVTFYEIRDASGQVRVSDAIPLPSFTQPVSTSYSFIQFGSQPGGAVEALTEGWSWSNFRAQFIP